MVKHIDSLDGLRAYSALAVLAFHTGIIHFWYGWVGVQFFFVISGFLISGILMDSRSAVNYFSTFYARRFLRIFPIYYACLAAVLLYCLVRHLPHRDFWWYLLYVQNFKLAFDKWNVSFPRMFDHTWSLAIEEQFYIFFPLLVRYLKDKYLVIVCFFIIFAAILVRYVLSIIYPGNPIVWANTVSSMDFLSAGVIIAISMNYGKLELLKKFLVYTTLVLLAAYSIVLYQHWHTTIFHVPFDLTDLHGQFFFVLLLPITSLVIVSLIQSKSSGIWRKVKHYIFENKAITYIGKISYGLYLFHFPVFWLVDDHLQRYGIAVDYNGSATTYLVAICKILITFLVAVLSWNFFETRVLRYKHNFRYKFIEK